MKKNSEKDIICSGTAAFLCIKRVCIATKDKMEDRRNTNTKKKHENDDEKFGSE